MAWDITLLTIPDEGEFYRCPHCNVGFMGEDGRGTPSCDLCGMSPDDYYFEVSKPSLGDTPGVYFIDNTGSKWISLGDDLWLKSHETSTWKTVIIYRLLNDAAFSWQRECHIIFNLDVWNEPLTKGKK